MANGEISVKQAVENEIADIKERSPELRCILHLADGFDNLKCKDHATIMKSFQSWKDKITGAVIILGCLVGGGCIGLFITYIKGLLE